MTTIYRTFTADRTTTGATIYRSYGTPVAIALPDGREVRTSRTYSATTSKHLKRFCPGFELIDEAEFRHLVAAA